MHPADIQAALKKKGFFLVDIARTVGVSKTLVSGVVYARMTSRLVAKAISSATGVPIEVLWPGQYTSTKTTPNARNRARLKALAGRS